jgi:hypothetical protein
VFCKRIGEENGEEVCDLDTDDTRLGEENDDVLFNDVLNNRLLIGEFIDDNDIPLPSLRMRCFLLSSLIVFISSGILGED